MASSFPEICADSMRFSELRFSQAGCPGTANAVRRGAVGPGARETSVSEVFRRMEFCAPALKPNSRAPNTQIGIRHMKRLRKETELSQRSSAPSRTGSRLRRKQHSAVALGSLRLLHLQHHLQRNARIVTHAFESFLSLLERKTDCPGSQVDLVRYEQVECSFEVHGCVCKRHHHAVLFSDAGNEVYFTTLGTHAEENNLSAGAAEVECGLACRRTAAGIDDHVVSSASGANCGGERVR